VALLTSHRDQSPSSLLGAPGPHHDDPLPRTVSLDDLDKLELGIHGSLPRLRARSRIRDRVGRRGTCKLGRRSLAITLANEGGGELAAGVDGGSESVIVELGETLTRVALSLLLLPVEGRERSARVRPWTDDEGGSDGVYLAARIAEARSILSIVACFLTCLL
jgi:hypothetical protein